MAALLQQAVGSFKYTIQLGSNVYIIQLRWNTRFQFWTVDLFDDGENPLVLCRKLVLGDLLYGELTLDSLPDVNIIPIDTTGNVQRIARGDLGNAVGIYAI